MEAVAKLKGVSMSARKMRMVVDMIRGQQVFDALDMLRFTKKEAASWLEKLVISAVYNWEHKLEGEESADDYDLYIKTIYCDAGPMLKRFRPRAQGRAARIRKHTCHVTLVVENRKPLPTNDSKTESEVVEEVEG